MAPEREYNLFKFLVTINAYKSSSHGSILKKRIFKRLVKINFFRKYGAINFDFRSGAKKSGHLDYPLQSYGPKQVRLISTQPWVGANKPDLFGAITLQRIIQMT